MAHPLSLPSSLSIFAPCHTWSTPRRQQATDGPEIAPCPPSTSEVASGRGYGKLVAMAADHQGRILHRASEGIRDSSTFNRRHMLLSSLLPLCLTPNEYALADQTDAVEEAELDSFGFDGLGTSEDKYAVGKVVALAQAGDGAVLFLGVDGFDLPLRMVVGAAEAMAILTAAQARRSRRPVTHEAWGSSLAAVGWKVDHVTITSMESDVFYSRLVLSLGPSVLRGGLDDGVSKSERFRSVDMRPSDAIALALRCRAPLFISKKVAEDAVGELKKGADPVKRPTDPLQRPGLQAKSETPNLSNGFISSR